MLGKMLLTIGLILEVGGVLWLRYITSHQTWKERPETKIAAYMIALGITIQIPAIWLE